MGQGASQAPPSLDLLDFKLQTDLREVAVKLHRNRMCVGMVQVVNEAFSVIRLESEPREEASDSSSKEPELALRQS